MPHFKRHHFTGNTDHDLTGLVDNQLIKFNGTNVISSDNVSSLSASTLDGGIIASGGTDLYDIFQPQDVVSIVLPLEYKFSTNTSQSDPGSGRFRLNDSVLSSSTNLYVSILTNGGLDVSNVLDTINSGTLLYIQELSDATKSAVFTVDSYVDNTSWLDVSVTYQSGSDLFGNNKVSQFALFAGNNTSDITRVQGGTNISTGGTPNFPIINLDNDIIVDSVSATTMSAGTIYSGSTDLYDIFTKNSDLLWSSGTGSNSIQAVPIISGGVIETEGNRAFNASFSSRANGAYSFVLGGLSNAAEGSQSGIIGGNSNYTSALRAVIIGGQGSNATANFATIIGSQSSDNNSFNSSIVGGFQNIISAQTSFGNSAIIAGRENTVRTEKSSIIGGEGNIVSGTSSIVLGGGDNVAGGPSSLASGSGATATGELSFSLGSLRFIYPGSADSPTLPSAFGFADVHNASGFASMAINQSTQAIGAGSFASGTFSIASGSSSYAGGLGTRAFGEISHAEGNQTLASGDFSHAEGATTTASTQNAHAEGSGTLASGSAAHSEGNSTTASGSASHAEGSSTTASGSAAHAEGTDTIASGNYSHAEGSGSEASGIYSHAEGLDTLASGDRSHAQGWLTEASGLDGHAEGRLSIAMGNMSHAQGLRTTASGIYSHAGGSGSLNSQLTASGQSSFNHSEINDSYTGEGAEGDNSAILGGINNSTHSSAVRSVVLGGQGLSATTADTVYVPNLNINSIGAGNSVLNLGLDSDGNVVTGTTAETYWTAGTGIDSIASKAGGNVSSGINSLAYGSGSTASGDLSSSNGHGGTAFTINSTVEGSQRVLLSPGNSTIIGILGSNYILPSQLNPLAGSDFQDLHYSSGASSHTEGIANRSLGEGAHAEGFQTLAGSFDEVETDGLYHFGVAAHAEGVQTSATTFGAHSEGGYTLASGEAAHAEGQSTIASGQSSHAEGQGAKAYANYSHAEGINSEAFGNSSHAEGSSTDAFGTASHAEGSTTDAYGFASHAEGQLTVASGSSSHSQNFHALAAGNYSHAGGRGANSVVRVEAYGEASFVHYGLSGLTSGRGAYADYSAILGGINGHVNESAERSVVLGGLNITATTADTVFVPSLNVSETLVGSIYTASTSSITPDGKMIIGVRDTSSSVTVTIQSADIYSGRIFIVKDESGGAGTNNITIATQGSETIDGASSVTITADYGVGRFYAGTDGNLYTW